MNNEPGCVNCKHYRGGVVCDAYPDLIPWPIQSGEVAHDKPLPGDNGIQFEPIEGSDNGRNNNTGN